MSEDRNATPIQCRLCAALFCALPRPGPLPQYCSRSCRQYLYNESYKERLVTARIAEKNSQRCHICDGPLGFHRSRYCSPKCASRAKNISQMAPLKTGTCLVCFVTFQSKWPRKYCSARCKSARWNLLRRTRKRGRLGTADRDITIVVVARRDSWRCWLCRRKVKPLASGAARASIDHLIPLSGGGEHIWSNVRLAHMGCNSRKQARLIPVQAALRIGA